MSDLSNHYALARRQAAWDGMEPDYDDPPVPMAVYLELREESEKLREQLLELVTEARSAADRLDRAWPCAGDRLLQLCNEIEGIEDDE